MFLEKHSRFFRKYELKFSPRHVGAPHLPLTAPSENYSIMDALSQRVAAEQALEVQSNGDIIELMDVKYREAEKALVLLIHRASPNAADPMYRKTARQEASKTITIREATKEPDEEQSVSAHLVISNSPATTGTFRAALEEIPGVSMAAIRRIISLALADYRYEFERGKKRIETYSTFRPEGVKSESMTNALKSGRINFVTLSRPASPTFIDADGLFRPEQEVLRLRVTGDIDSKNWQSVFSNLVTRAKGDGWSEFKVDIDLEDTRNRTVKLDRDAEAKEILFVRSEQAAFKKTLPACSIDIVDEVVEKALVIARAP